MAIKINIGINRKVGEPGYSSRGASCNVEFDLDGNFDNSGTERFHNAARKAYAACREAVDAELSANGIGGAADAANGRGGQHHSPGHHQQNGNDYRNPNQSNVRRATASQVRAIHAIANRNRVDLTAMLSREYRADRPEELSIGDASQLIDRLKGTADRGQGTGR